MSTVGQVFTFNYTGNPITWVVPEDIASIKIECYGAGASMGGSANGGNGGYIRGDINTNNETLYIYLGHSANGTTSGWNGGGSGFWNTVSSYSSGGGGGATDIRLGGTALSNRIMVAGGGGGGIGYSNRVGNAGGNSATTSTLGQGYTAKSITESGGGGGYYGGASGCGGSNYSTGFSNVVSIIGGGSVGGQSRVAPENGKCIITVLSLVIPITNFSLNKTQTTILVGNTEKLIPTVLPDNANQTVTWQSYNTSVATINSAGLITAKSVGTAAIGAWTYDGKMSNSCYVTVLLPLLNTLTISSTTTHTDSLVISGNIIDNNDNGQLQYQILLNNKQIYPESGFTESVDSIATVDYTILHSQLLIDDNILIINYIDNFSLSGSKSFTITKTNTNPTIITHIVNGCLYGSIDDTDGDSIQYQIVVNDNQLHPESGYTDLVSTPLDFIYPINRSNLLLREQNTIQLNVLDSLGGASSQSITFTGEYVGLMFMDEQNNYYSSDLGELLQYLDFGTIISGNTTNPIKIYIQNKFGFPITDIIISSQNNLFNANLEFSYSKDPFIPTNTLQFNDIYQPNSINHFYVRVSTTQSTISTIGSFTIHADAKLG